MPPSISSLTSRWGADTGALRFFWRAGPIAIVHLAALIVLFQTEYYDVPRIGAFLLTWGFLNFAWLAVLRRPGVSAVMSLAMVAILIQVSELKYKVIWQTVSFVDLMVIDLSSFTYLLAIFPALTTYVVIGVTIASAVVILLWRLDPFRMRRLAAIAGALRVCLDLAGSRSRIRSGRRTSGTPTATFPTSRDPGSMPSLRTRGSAIWNWI